MTTTLAANPVDDPDLLTLLADPYTPLAIDFADAFRAACHDDALAHGGLVHPSRVSALLHERLGDFARAGSVALALTARQVWLRDFPPPPTPPGQRREQTPVVGTPGLGKTG